jgi:hypothetical protein
MGFNSTIVILNDRLHDIAATPDFGKQLETAILTHGYPQRVCTRVVGTEVVTVDHADTTNVIAVGGNCASVLSKNFNGGNHHSDKAKLDLLKYWASEMGYTLRKKK